MNEILDFGLVILDLAISAAVGRAMVPYVGRKLRQAHRLLRSAPQELSVAFVGDKQMSLLHQQFMGIAGPTDVLSFELEVDDRGRVRSGEVVVCIPEARRQAKRRKMPVEREVLLYALHGLLHLSGFDDKTEEGFRKMHRKEDQILQQLGVGRVFAPEGAPRPGRPQPRRGAR